MYRLLGMLGFVCGEMGRIRIPALAALLVLIPTNLFVAAGCFWITSYSLNVIREGRKINQSPDLITIDALVREENPRLNHFVEVTGELHPKLRKGPYAAFRDPKTNSFIYVKTADEYDNGPPRTVTITGLVQKIPGDQAFSLGTLQKDIANLVGPFYMIGRKAAVEEGTHPPSVPLWGSLAAFSAFLGFCTLAAIRYNNMIFIREGLAQVREIDEHIAPSLEGSGLSASGPYLEASDPRPALDLAATLQVLSNGEIIVNAASASASAPLGRLVGRDVEVGTFYCGFGPPRQAVRINGQIVLTVSGEFPLQRVVACLGATPQNYVNYKPTGPAAMPTAA
jgi:hypothetical protein